ncbi:MAG: ABC transporter substrate-binding protein [Candidatus Hydrogenedentes bacterium]|nr:ABC transporter substrate-binding protein [Candidatus Hydrogenedentota bacterium]
MWSRNASIWGWRWMLLACAAIWAGCGAPPADDAATPPPRGGIVSFAPNITETVFALGQGDRVVGVTSFCTYPPEVAKLERLGGYMNPDLEKLTLLAPGLILVQGKNQELSDVAAHNGTPVVHVNMDSLATIDAGIETLGEALDCRAEADALRAKIAAELDGVRAAVAGRRRPTVLVISLRPGHDLDNLFTVGGPSFLSEVVDVAGGDNLYAGANQAYLEASKETIVAEAPDVILEFRAGEELSDEERARFVADWRQLPSLPAVAQGRVHVITEAYALIPGPRVPMLARRIAALLHPEARIPEP